MSLVGAMRERKTTYNAITGTVTLFWSVLFRQHGRWYVIRVETDGYHYPHTPAAIRAAVRAEYGSVGPMATAGPYWDRLEPSRVVTLAQTDLEFFNGWANQAY